MAVAPKGAAEKAGLAEGDRIVEAGGEAAKARPIAEWRVRWCEQPAGTHVPLRVANGGAERRVELVLADAIPAHARAAGAGH